MRDHVVTCLVEEHPIETTAAFYKSVESLCSDPAEENSEFREFLIHKLLNQFTDSTCIHYSTLWSILTASIEK